MSCCEEAPETLAAEARILLAGQPNCGKTSVFNALTGAGQRVGNWPGVTVERKEGRSRHGPAGTVIVDIPGTYSLESASLDEAVARDALASFPEAVIVNVVDSSLLERQLALTLELLSLGRPMVIALTMTDELAAADREVDCAALSEALCLPVIVVDGRTGAGAAKLVDAALAESGRAPRAGAAETLSLRERAGEARRIAAAVTIERCAPPSSKAKTGGGVGKRIAARVDRAALSPVAGPLAFLAVVFLMFEATFGLGSLVIGLMEGGLDALSTLAAAIPFAPAASFVQGALLGGVGNVILLVPYVFFMFLFLSFLEDSGYMARAVFATDALMRRIGLNGKAFIPLVMGFGCNVPAIMAIRTIESPRDRLRATLMVPFTSCSARLPVYVVVAGAFFGAQAGIVIFSLYVAGMAAGVLTAALSSRLIPPESGSGLVMEMPPFRLPLARNLLLATWNRTKDYLTKAGTVILAASAILWLLSSLPWGKSAADSLIGLAGRAIAPVFAPLGFDWRIAVGLISGFAAKEIVISTLGLLSGPATSLSEALPSMMGPATALAFLVFTLLYTPCLATLAVMRSETGSRKWTAVSVGWGLLLAYASAFAVRGIAIAAGLAA